MNQISENLVDDLGPGAVRGGDKARDAPLPTFLHQTVVVEIQFPIDDFPELRIPLRCVSLAHRPGAVAATLRRLSLRIFLERIAVCGTCEAQLGAVPGRREFLRTLQRVAGLELGSGILPLHSDVVEGARADRRLVRSDRHGDRS